MGKGPIGPTLAVILKQASAAKLAVDGGGSSLPVSCGRPRFFVLLSHRGSARNSVPTASTRSSLQPRRKGEELVEALRDEGEGEATSSLRLFLKYRQSVRQSRGS